MVKSCCIPDCDNYQQNSTLFSVPKSEILFNEWSRVVAVTGLVLQKAHFICEQHFEKFNIEEVKMIKNAEGKIIFQRRLQKKRLLQGAVPSLFGERIIYSQSVDSKDYTDGNAVNKAKTPALDNVGIDEKVDAVDDIIRCKLDNIDENNERLGESDVSYIKNDDIASNSELLIDTNQDMGTEVSQDLYCTEEVPTFSSIFNGTIKPKLPNQCWGSTMQQSPDKILFLKSGKLRKDQEVPWIQKQIVWNDNLTMDVYLLGKYFVTWTNLNTLSDVQDVIHKVDTIKVCVGGPRTSEYKNVTPRCAYKDCTGHWRHNKCTLEVNNGMICNHCANLDNTLGQHLRMKRKSIRQHIPLSPAKKKKLEIVRKAAHIQSQTILRNKRRLQYAKGEVESLLTQLAQIENRTLDDHLKKLCLPESQILLIKECASVSKCKTPNGRKYTHQWVLLCLLLRIRSPAAYNFLRENSILPLPSKSTMHRYLSNVNLDYGFDKEFFKSFREKLNTLPTAARHGVLLFDEMLVRKSIYVNTKTLTFEGLSTVQSAETEPTLNDLADHALVFMFSSLQANFHQPVATFASKNASKGTLLASLVLQAIIEIEKAGGYVDGIICDGGSNNKKMWTEFGVTGKIGNVTHYLENPCQNDRKIYVFSDTPHLIKCIRNRLLANDLKVDSKLVSWRFYKSLYEQDCKELVNRRVCPKLTINHIAPSDTAKMRVFLATQVFSNSVADGLTFFQKRNADLFKNCDGTIEFTRIINNLFDSLNRKYPAEGIRQNGKDMKLLEQSLKWIDNWEDQLICKKINKSQFLTQTTAEGSRVTIHSTLQLCNDLLKTDEFKYVLTAKVNQDRLEQFFGIIRQAGGQNDHPTLPTFLQLFKLLSIYKLIKPPKFGNCRVCDIEASPAIAIEKFDWIFKQPTTYKTQHMENLMHDLDHKIETQEFEFEDVFLHEHNYASGNVVDCIIYYVSGFLCRKMMKHTKCTTCKKAFESNTDNSNLPEAELVNLKNRGGLIYTNSYVYNLLRTAETYFATHITGEANNVYESTIHDVINHYNIVFPCEIHKETIIAHCLHYYVLMRMRQWAKVKTNDLVKASKEKKKQAKLMKV